MKMTPQKLARLAADWLRKIDGRWVVAPNGDNADPAIRDPRLSDVAAVATELARQMNCD